MYNLIFKCAEKQVFQFDICKFKTETFLNKFATQKNILEQSALSPWVANICTGRCPHHEKAVLPCDHGFRDSTTPVRQTASHQHRPRGVTSG